MSRAHERLRRALAVFISRAVLAVFVVVVAGGFSAAGADGTPQTSSSPAPPPAKDADERASATPHQVAAQAAAASQSAAVAAQAAKVASSKALEASKQAAVASRQASKMTASRGSDASASSAKASSETLSLVDGTPDAQADAQTALLVEKLRQADHDVNRGALGPDDQRRMLMADQLLRGAQKSLDAKDYTAAGSLASKASVILTPLIGTHSPAGARTP